MLIGAAFVIPANAEEPQEPPSRKELLTSQNNLKQIALAYHVGYDVSGVLPTDIKDKDGKPLLSWRVAILPYVEQEQLYRQFKLDEAWDSDNNKKLIEKMPKLYAPVYVKAKAGETFYQTFTGLGALFGGKAAPKLIDSITDGTSNTLLVAEAGSPVIWSKPGDIPFDEKKPLPKLGGLFGGDFHIALADGSIARIRKDFDEAEMKKLIMPADGNTLDWKKLKK
jgi:hypothetical protein